MKQQAIKAAYGEFWAGLSNEKQKYALENEGWIKVAPSQYQMDMFSRLKINKNTHSVRPKSLSGIRYNRGWARIESEEDLPKEYKNYWCRTYNGDTKILRFDPEFKEWYCECNTGLSFTVTHYQPIETPKPPIF
ncbi:hypothetical protein [Elizabethkingia anophelis]|uniref:Uncharacterized protein n=1 Tax=Elizabethkingia anophelis TaxID=1117645 RepID=A0A7Z7LUP4_9FLAO|nr:hypothetical protein [Elizabethkingia anophelis]MDV3630451.1 hypothetical protein [Elizabethkingia anophelis]MDV3704735.1 hypothetical protein [Elizabethkingia anophelis]MDV3722953.1 hypothetical protein [Elizabethkingia anophelis]STC97719.1 Uncharacterised protein [Elizabethkingia anophelis]